MTRKGLVMCGAAAMMMTLALPAAAVFSGTDVFLPSVGMGAGAGTSYWYTTVWVHNPGTSAVDVQFQFLERGRSNATPSAVYNDTIVAGATRRYANALDTIFGIRDRRFGAIRVVSSDKVVVNGRIYSKVQNGPEEDSVGQFFAAVPASFAIGQGERTTLLGVYQTSPQADSDYRYNFGFVETVGETVQVRVSAVDESGREVGSKDYSLLAFEPKQNNITDLLPGVDAANLRLVVEVIGGSGKVVAFGSGLANRSNDPSTFEMTFADSLLGGGGGGGGSDAFSLPYEGTVASTASAFKVTNSGGGAAIEGRSSGFGPAVKAESTAANGTAIEGKALSGTGAWGVSGSSQDGVGVRGLSQTGPAVLGSSASGAGVKGVSTSSAGVYGESGVTAVKGASTSPTGRTYGVYATAVSSQGIGVYGEAAEASSLSEDSYGGYFVANGWGDTGVVGLSKWAAGSGEGGHFESAAQYGYGVYAEATNATGENAGVWGVSRGAAGIGVYGRATDASGTTYGVYGRASSPKGFGVYGANSDALGVAIRGEGGVVGVEGTTRMVNGAGLWGEFTPGNNFGFVGTKQFGVYGKASTDQTNDSGVKGESSSGATNGVYGETWSPSDGAAGVFGVHNTGLASGAGVWGRSLSSYGVGGMFENRNAGVGLWAGASSIEGGANSIIELHHLFPTGASKGRVFRVTVTGEVYANGTFHGGGGADLAERVDVTDLLAPGDVVEIDPDDVDRFRLARTPYSNLVAGVVSSQPGMTMNNDRPGEDGAADGRPLLALAGRVPVKATTEGGRIRVGDLLVASSTPGHAMRCSEAARCAGAVIGKALQPLAEGTGSVMMLVALQ